MTIDCLLRNAVNHQSYLVALFSLALTNLLFPVSGAMAQTKVTPIPSNLTVLGTQCDVLGLGCEATTRNILLRSDSAIDNLRIYSMDLNRSDGAAVFPAAAIRPMLSQTSLSPNQPLTIPIQFDLAQVPNGEYSGSLLLSYTQGELTIPLTVRVKHRPLFPLFALLSGVGLGIGISSYRMQGMAREEILGRVGRLRSQMQADPELDASFERQITNYLIDVETALEGKRWETAQQATERAFEIWDKWRKDCQEWVSRIQYRQELSQRLQAESTLKTDSFYLQSMGRQLEDLARQTVDLASPLQLRDALDDWQQQFNRYLQGRSKLERLKKLVAKLALEQQAAWLHKIEPLQLSLESLSPEKQDGFTTWQKNADTLISELIQILAKQKDMENSYKELILKNSPPMYPLLASRSRSHSF